MPLRRFDTVPDTRAKYLIAIVAVLAIVGLRLPLIALGQTGASPFLLFATAVLVAAWFGGWGPGLLATALGAFVAVFFFVEPLMSFSGKSEELVSVGMFILQGVFFAWMGASRLDALRQARSLLADLESRVEQRTQALRTANEQLHAQARQRERDHEAARVLNAQLQQSNRELQDFASVASHDLQEPLRKIRAFGDRLSQRFTNELGRDGQDYLARMLKSAERMQVLINDLLTFSRVTTKGQPFVRTDLAEVAAGVVSDLEARIEQTGATVDVGPLPTIDADPLQMRQLLQNLVGNALKFARSGVAPHVRVSAESVPDEVGPGREMIRLAVADNGIGFDEKYLDRVFDVFQRLHGRQDYEGTGIGLAVCRKIAKRHGGDITARSVPGNGATFFITLPARHVPDEAEAEATGVFSAISE